MLRDAPPCFTFGVQSTTGLYKINVCCSAETCGFSRRYFPVGFALALCLHFLAAANSTNAADVDLTDVIGGACVPDSATVRAGLYETAGFGVRLAARAGFGCSVPIICTPTQ